MITVHGVVDRVADVRDGIGSLLKERGMFLGERIAGDGLALWARRAAGAALVAFGVTVLVSSLIGGT